MGNFEYTAMTAGGDRVTGTLAGASEQAVLAELESRRLTPLSIRVDREVKVWRRGPGARALGTAYAQVADLLKAGVPLLRALQLLAGRKRQTRLTAAFRDVAQGVADGEDLAEAMSNRADVFPRVHVAMVRAGEKGGFLEQVFERLGAFVLAQAEMRSKIIGSLIYPSVLIGFGGLMLGVIFAFFVPMFRPMFEQIQGGLPMPTRVVLACSALATDYGLACLVAAVLAIVGARMALRRPSIAFAWARMWTFSPIVGSIIRSVAVARFCRMLGTMLVNGIPILSAMQIAKEAAGNRLLEESISRASEEVKAGGQLAGPLRESGLLGEDVVEMLIVAEAANALDKTLLTIAETLEQRVDRLLGGAVKLLEPIMLLIIGGIVVFVAIALIMPMTQLTGAIGR